MKRFWRAREETNSRKHVRGVSLLAVSVCAGLVACDAPAGEGSPFRLSKSVTNYCAQQPVLAMCAAFEPLLEEFLSESRDSRWAAPVEDLIAKSMLVNGKPWAEIRALECRRTMCALEYAVPVDDLSRDVDGDRQLEATVEPVGGVVAPEPGAASGQGSMVSVMIWRRRP